MKSSEEVQDLWAHRLEFRKTTGTSQLGPFEKKQHGEGAPSTNWRVTIVGDSMKQIDALS
jgi:hypothetical protein